MSKSAFELVLVTAIRLTALSPAVLITTPLPTANLSAVTVGTEVEDSATRAVPTDASTNNQDQGGEPFWSKAVDKGRRLWEALTLLWVELPLRGPSASETPIGVDDRGFSLPLKAEQLIRGDGVR
jgi:hypothetical protein